MCSRSFHLIASFLLLRSSSSGNCHRFLLAGDGNISLEIVSESTEKTCSADDDCAHQLTCQPATNMCVCPEPFFWREDAQSCFGCAPGWVDLETDKCLLYAVSSSSGVKWFQVHRICKDLMAEPMLISSTDEFQALQRKTEYMLKGETALMATLYFHQGAWIDINNGKSWSSFPAVRDAWFQNGTNHTHGVILIRNEKVLTVCKYGRIV